MVKLNIPIDLFYTYGGLYKHDFSKERQYGIDINYSRHFVEIKSMWMSLDKQYFTRFNEEPYFIVKFISDEPRNEDKGYDYKDMHLNYVVRQNETKIVDIMYNYVMEHEEVMTSRKYNL